MKNKKLLVFFLFVLLFSFKASAQEICSKNGYTVLTINGMLTNESDAILNKNLLRYKLSNSYNNQPLTVDYVYNQTHLGGFGDLVDAVRQGLFNSGSDYDLVEMLSDASKKVNTQKLLLVGYSQGNFYANSFYNRVANMEGGVPGESIGVYAVATPDTYVAGGGKYITSDTDKVIAAVVGRVKNILSPNVHISLTKDDGDGHSFSNVYLKYRSKEIIQDIKSSLGKLTTNNIQDVSSSCLSPVKISMMHKIKKAIVVVSDYVVDGDIKLVSNIGSYLLSVEKSIAKSLLNLPKKSLALVSGLTEEIIGKESSSDQPESVVVENTQKLEQNNTSNDKLEDIEEKANNENLENINPVVEDTTPLPETETPQDTTSSIFRGKHSSGVTNETPEVTPTTPNDNPTEGTEDPTNPDPSTPVTPETPVTPSVDSIGPVINLVGDNLVVVKLNSIYTEEGAVANDNVDGAVPVTVSGSVDTSIIGEYTVTYTAKDSANNISTLNRIVRVATYKYIPISSFGKNNGDGFNWQVWYFNGSSIYDWTDTYIDNYLHEQLKFKLIVVGFIVVSVFNVGYLKMIHRKVLRFLIWLFLGWKIILRIIVMM